MLNVLVVDDLREDRLIAKKLLSPHYKVTTLSSATEAKAYAITHCFDVALINVMLQDDLDCIDLLKDLEKISSLPFLSIAITCHIDEIRYQKVRQAGFEFVLKKPFDKYLFNDIVCNALMRSEGKNTRYSLS